MTEREKLVELLRATCTPERCAVHGEKRCFECVADHLFANGVTVQKWIPVSERKPNWSQEVIVYGGNYLKACVTAMRFWDESHANWVGFTHWMPLPEPPKEA